jgi:hypothetical protein
MRSILMLMLALPIFAACERATTRAPAAEHVSPRDAAAQDGVAAFFEGGPMQPGGTRAELAAALGPPDSVHSRAVPNRHDATVTDSIVTLFHDGLVAEFHFAGYDGKEILAALQISDDRYLRPDSPVRLGEDEAAVRAALGEPDVADIDFLEYTCEGCLVAGHEAVVFVLERGAVRRIDLRCWVD